MTLKNTQEAPRGSLAAPSGAGLFDALLPPGDGRPGLFRDLEALLTTRAPDFPDDHPLALGPRGYGLPDPPYGTVEFDVQTLTAHLMARQIRRFEPRLVGPKV